MRGFWFILMSVKMPVLWQMNKLQILVVHLRPPEYKYAGFGFVSGGCPQEIIAVDHPRLR